MKKAGVTLGIVGSFFALYCALITFNAETILKYPGLMTELSGAEGIVQALISLRWVLSSVLFVSLLLGLIGAALLCKKGAVSGVLLVAAAVLSAVSVCGIVSAICYALGAIFAFVSDKRCTLSAQSSEDNDSQDFDMGI